ncbi:hypothetical protein NL676_016641 [Syzygium grande]|nr:hypothetical protein NL676_016641 [Syzygium grande]
MHKSSSLTYSAVCTSLLLLLLLLLLSVSHGAPVLRTPFVSAPPVSLIRSRSPPRASRRPLLVRAKETMILTRLAAEEEVIEAMAPCYFGDRSSSDTVRRASILQIVSLRNGQRVRSLIPATALRNALGILRVAVELECPQIVSACVNYLEAVPWEETEEEEILKTIPSMGSQVLPILSRLEPVNPLAIMRIFQSAIQLATSSPPPDMNDLKTSAQEQLEYMLTEDDDEPLLKADDEIRSEVKQCMSRLFARFNSLLESLFCESSELASEALHVLQFYLSDLSWACQILTKLEIMRDLVICWMDASDKVVKIVHPSNPEPNGEMIKTTLKTVEVAAKVLESIAYGNVILPASKRLHAVKVWLPFVRVAKPAIDSAVSSDDGALELKVDGELWQSLESTFVSLVLTLPSGDQADILTEWFGNNYIRYPDLTEAFDVWCYRSKVAKRRLAILDMNNGGSSTP